MAIVNDNQPIKSDGESRCGIRAADSALAGTAGFARRIAWGWRPVFLAMAMALHMPSFAHDGPEHEIAELTDRITKEGESADLLIERAVEYNVLGKLAEAARDLERALHFEPHSAGACRELSRTYFTSGKTNEALRVVSRAIETAPSGPDHASLFVVRAEILRARAEHGKALEDTNHAIAEHAGNVEWYLLRSQLQARLKIGPERLLGIEDGIRETGAGVLETERINALIDSGQAARAVDKIETELRESRWKASWLIRRARVHLAARKAREAKADLEAAVAELDGRIHPTTSDSSLFADRGLAFEFLGRNADAQKDYETARDKGFTDEWMLDRLQALKNIAAEKRGRGK